MARAERPLFGDTASGDIADLISYLTAGQKTFVRPKRQQKRKRTVAQQAHNDRYAQAHAEWMRLPKQPVTVKKRRYYRRIPDWPTFFKQWLEEHP